MNGLADLAPKWNALIRVDHGVVGQDPPALVHEDWDYNMHAARFTRHLKAGERYTFSIAGTVISSAQTADAQNEAERLTLYAALGAARAC